MKVWLIACSLLFAPASSHGQGGKTCDELKSEIATKLDAKGVKGYSLEIVDKDKEAGDAKVVGTCERSTKKILYSRTAAAPQNPSKEPAKH